jgi:glycosyltransferase 2 family protein
MTLRLLNRNNFHLLLRISISVILMAVLALNTDLIGLLNIIVSADIWYLLIALLTTMVGVVISVLRWQILVKAFDKMASFYHMFRLVCLSLFYNFFVPGGFAGDIVRGIQTKNAKMNQTQGLASVFIDRIMGLLAFMILGILGIIISFRLLEKENFLFITAVLFLGIILVLFVLNNRQITKRISRILQISQFLHSKLSEFYHYVAFYKEEKILVLQALLISLIMALLNTATFYFIGLAVGSDVFFGYFLLFIPIITVVSYIPITYSGLGLREYSFVLLFTQVGMKTNALVSISLLYFGIILVLALLGMTYYILTGRNYSVLI